MGSWDMRAACSAAKNRTVSDNLGEHTVLLYDHSGAVGLWEPSRLPVGQVMRQPQPLFRKLDVKIVEEERARLGQPHL